MRRLLGDIGQVGLILLAATGLLWGMRPAEPVRSAAHQPPSSVSYDLKIDGAYTGTGKGVVSGQSIKITGTVSDSEGHNFNLTADNLPVDRNRFYGSGTLNSVAIQICGRIDPVDKNITNYRICGTLLTADDKACRVFGVAPKEAAPTTPPGDDDNDHPHDNRDKDKHDKDDRD